MNRMYQNSEKWNPKTWILARDSRFQLSGFKKDGTLRDGTTKDRTLGHGTKKDRTLRHGTKKHRTLRHLAPRKMELLDI